MTLIKYKNNCLYLFFLLSILFFSCTKRNDLKNTENIFIEIDSASIWIGLSQDRHLNIDKRRKYLSNAFIYNEKQKNDSIRGKNLSKISFEAYKLKDSFLFKKSTKKALDIFKIKKDTFGLADIQWNFGAFLLDIQKMDSSYYYYHKAYLNFKSLNHEYYSGKMLYNLAFIQSRIKNYVESEKLTFQAISKFKPLEKHLNLYRCYNHLGNVYMDLGEYEKSIIYFDKALEYLKRVSDKKMFQEWTLNNIGLVNQRKGNYNRAIYYFNKVLNSGNIKEKNIYHYARVIDNIAYNKLLSGDTTNLLTEFNIALKIRDSLQNKSGIGISKIHMAEYFTKYNDKLKAVYFAKGALDISKEIKNNRDILTSLKLLSEIDEENSYTYLNKYISLNDSLQKEERKIRDKFARIEFETEEYIAETKRLSQQKIQMLIISLTILLILSLFYYIRIQKARNEKLILEAEQQEINKEIYELTIKQQIILEEEKTKERNRISEELHDGILGKLFGLRLNLGFLDIKGDRETLTQHEIYLEELQVLEEEIREVSHKLNSNIISSEVSFNAIIDLLLENSKKIGNFTYQLNIGEDISWKEINEVIKVNIYRILQESLQNIVKYAQAKNVVVDFTIKDENFIVNISDDGTGFNMNKTKKGIGLKNMKSRIQKLNGVFSINSEIGRGTTIYFTIPIY